ncbi:MAG: hypothetical protein P4L99_05245 [Chthoniobacter sp.]|nr:hypothetical protein [Chthoniobacter sp.]
MTAHPHPAATPNRRVFGNIRAFACLAFLSAATLAHDDLPKDIAARLAPKWLAAAKQIRTPERVVYYHGSATGNTAPDGQHWIGQIKGEVLVLTSDSAAACPELELGPTGSLAVHRQSQTKIVEAKPPWQNLLERSK